MRGAEVHALVREHHGAPVERPHVGREALRYGQIRALPCVGRTVAVDDEDTRGLEDDELVVERGERGDIAAVLAVDLKRFVVARGLAGIAPCG